MPDMLPSPQTKHPRHSFADLARRGGWSVYDISKALRHSSLKVTERYLSGLDTGGMGERMGALFGPEG